MTSLNTKIQNFDNNPETRKEQSKREAEDDFERELKSLESIEGEGNTILGSSYLYISLKSLENLFCHEILKILISIQY